MRQKQDKKFSTELTKEQIAIIKASLRYYIQAEYHGFALWTTIPGATFDSDNVPYARKVNEIYEKLNGLTRVKPDFGGWSDIKRTIKLYEEDYKIAKKEGAEAEIKMYEEGILHETISEHFGKFGLKGSEIASKILEEFHKKSNEMRVSLSKPKANKKEKEETSEEETPLTDEDLPF